MMPESVSVLLPVWTVPPAVLMAKALANSRASAPTLKAPPSRVTVPVPTALALFACKVPAEITVPPE